MICTCRDDDVEYSLQCEMVSTAITTVAKSVTWNITMLMQIMILVMMMECEQEWKLCSVRTVSSS